MSGQLLDPGPLQDGCDPETCTDRAGGDHSDRCIPALTENELRARDRQIELGLGPDLTTWAPGEITEAYGR